MRAADHLSQLDEVEKHYKARIAHLEARVTDLVAERAKEQVKHAKEQRFKDGLIKDLQIQLQEELDLVSRRQQEVEKLGPVLSQQLAAAKQQLVGDNISDAVYAELATKAPEQRSLAEEVRLITYVGLAKLRQENEQLRLASQVCTCKTCDAHHSDTVRARVSLQHWQIPLYTCESICKTYDAHHSDSKRMFSALADTTVYMHKHH